MTAFADIIGHETPKLVLERMLDNERVPQALLFLGPDGVGKATLARAFAAALLCGSEGLACGSCASCRLFESGGHPDFLLVTRLPKTDRPKETELVSVISVDQVRDLSQLAAQAPRQGQRRIFIIDPADRMNPAAQNALLKTLEEPSARSVILLVAARPHLLLPTVRSRCFSLRFAGLRPDELQALLERQGLTGDEARLRSALGDGRPGTALELDLEELRQRRQELLDVLERLVRQPQAAAELPALAASLAGKTEHSLSTGLDLLQGLLRDVTRCGADAGERLLHIDLHERLAALSTQLPPARAAALVQSIDRLRAQSRLNLNRTLVAESLLAAAAGGPLP